jgi:replicative DNA helicase
LVPRDLETYLCGAALANPEAVLPACRWLSSAAFGHPDTAMLWAALVETWDEFHGVDIGLVYTVLARRGFGWAQCGGFDYVSRAMTTAPAPLEVERWAEEISRYHRRRQAVSLLGEAHSQLSDPSAMAEPAMLGLQEQMRRLLGGNGRGNHDLGSEVDDVLTELTSGIRIREHIATGTPFVDELLCGGLEPGTVTVLAARPSVGKSCLALQWALEAARAGHGVCFASLEMSRAEITNRALAHLAVVDHEAIRWRRLDGIRLRKVQQAGHLIRGIPLRVYDSSRMTVADLAGYASQVPGLRLVVVDYLQLLSVPRGHRLTGEERVAEISRDLVGLSKALDCAFLVVSQLRRPNSSDRRPSKGRYRGQLTDLRGSGSIEQDADVVVFLDEDDEPEADPAQVVMRVAKNRHGRRTGEMECKFRKSVQSIRRQFRHGTEGQPAELPPLPDEPPPGFEG